MIEARRRLRLGALLLVIAITLGAAITFLGTSSFDTHAVAKARELRVGWFGQLMESMSDVGYARWLVPIALVLALVLAIGYQRWRDALVVALGTVLGAVVTRLLKEMFERSRPSDGVDQLFAGFSMPSGHATSSAAFATTLVLVSSAGRQRHVVLVLGAAFALLVGLSRVVLGAHYPSDVIAGLCAGAGVALLVAAGVAYVPRRTTR